MTDFAYRRMYKIGSHEVEFAFNDGRMEVSWLDDITADQTKNWFLNGYRKARDDFLKSMGLNIVVVEI